MMTLTLFLILCLCFRHVLFAPSLHNSYAGASFPGLEDLLYSLPANEPVPGDHAKEIEEHLAMLTYYIKRAGDLLLGDIDFMDDI